ncbi:glucose-6-phosphate dehydrogenase [Thiothrix litoralis]|jgi:glucose-6-phosphate 1-dehydrogenase|uniref:Glucose-6-phosphate 1-dehydrogenase n=1 Tax=Thiothrix litoralis TaxID=2891210 RepID=A0ABX7WWM1_9GAMM|nr:glucose-6-phosphate dehydrogenase [Thiothrix litoralis]QTR47562.1 glucose-6-phosphate dehydrogenase [Thiothrix litoralis]
MSHVIIPVEVFDLVIFGGTGDLALRKLLPALFRRDAVGQIPPQARIIALALDHQTLEEYRAQVADALQTHLRAVEAQAETLARFLERLEYHAVDLMSPASFQSLATILDTCPERIRIYYLAVAPALFSAISHGLAGAGLAGNNARLVLEKPLGHDHASAALLNAQVGEVFDEHAIYRIDHYLGKETVQNLMALRFANALFEPVWNAQCIDHVQITAAESLGVGSRGGYYDTAGAIRDMVQNHLLQLLCLIAIEPPYRFEADAVRDEKLKVLRSLRPLSGRKVLDHTVRGQYLASSSSPAYIQEVGNPASMTESYVALKVEIDSWRWSGVPFYLRTGKRLKAQSAEIAVVFKQPSHLMFGDLPTPILPNVLTMRLQPDEGLRLHIMTKEPGPGGFRLHDIPLDMAFAEGQNEDWRMPDAYERLLMDVVRGNQTLFMRGDEVEAAWQWIDPIIEAWQLSGRKPDGYDPGTSGPISAIEMMARDGRRWREIES